MKFEALIFKILSRKLKTYQCNERILTRNVFVEFTNFDLQKLSPHFLFLRLHVFKEKQKHLINEPLSVQAPEKLKIQGV